MGFYEIVVPEAEINLVTNPSLETAVTGYSAVGGTVARVATQSRRGSYSLEIDPTTGVNDGAFFGTVSLVSGQTYTFAVDVKGVSGIPYRIYFGTTGGAVLGTPTTFTGAGDWQRVYVTYTETATTTRRLYLVKNNSANGDIFYADGWHCSQKSYNTTYVDGDQEGCEWDGEEHASTSSRSAQSRAGGRIYNLDDLGMYVIESAGLGMAPVRHKIARQSLLPGALYRGSKVEERPLTIVADVIGSSYTNLHSLRKTIVDYIKADRVKDDQAFLLRYTGANSNKPTVLKCRYDGGMEFKSPEGFTERAALRVIAYDPYWYEEGEASAALSLRKSVSNANNAIRREDGIWSSLGTGLSSFSYDIAYDKARDRIYFAGNFATANGVTVNRICYWNGTTFVAMDAGVNGSVRAIAIAPNGDVWIGGAFTTVGSGATACKGLARWNVSTGTWTAFNPSTATFASIWSLAIDSSGDLYIGGYFTDWNGNANADYIAKYQNGSWVALGTGTNALVFAISVAADGKVYVGGSFTTANGVTVHSICYWNGTTFVAMGNGISGGTADVFTIGISLDGSIIIGGNFTPAGGVSANNIARWNGPSFAALGSGTNGSVYELEFDDKGILFVGGNFTVAGGITLADKTTGWNGSSWFHLPVNLPGSPPVTVNAILTIGDDLYYGYNDTGTATTSEITTVSNPGSARAYPVVEITRSEGTSAVVEWLRNETTGKRLYLNYALQSGEKLTIDLTPGARQITSSYRGAVWEAALRNSDLGDFYLLPGDNDISAFVNQAGSPTMTAFMKFPIAHESADGVA